MLTIFGIFIFMIYLFLDAPVLDNRGFEIEESQWKQMIKWFKYQWQQFNNFQNFK